MKRSALSLRGSGSSASAMTATTAVRTSTPSCHRCAASKAASRDGGVAAAAGPVDRVAYALGANITCPGGKGSSGPVDCVSPGSEFFSAPAAAAIADAVAAAKAADVTVCRVYGESARRISTI